MKFLQSPITVALLLTADISINKMVQVTERLRVQFRAEAFDALNRFKVFPVRYNTNPLDAGTSSGNMRDSPPQSVQLGLKVLW